MGAQDAAVAALAQTRLISQQQGDSWLKYTFRCTFCELIWHLANLILNALDGLWPEGLCIVKTAFVRVSYFPSCQPQNQNIPRSSLVYWEVAWMLPRPGRGNRDRCEPGPRLLLLVTMETLLNYRRDKMQIFHPLHRVLMTGYYPDSRYLTTIHQTNLQIPNSLSMNIV